jgi:Tfp pilus assembly protein PilO
MLKKILILSLPLSSIAIIVWLLLPEYNALKSVQADKTDADDALRQKQILVDKIKGLESQYRKVEGLASKVSQIVPPDPDVPNLLVEIPELVAAYGMTLKDMSFDETGSNATFAGSSNLRAMQANITVSGPYDYLTPMLRGIEKELRIMDVQSIEFKVPRESNTESAGGTYDFKIDLQIYYGLQA